MLNILCKICLTLIFRPTLLFIVFCNRNASQVIHMYRVVIPIMILLVSSCAYRTVQSGNPGEFEPVYNLYSRNFVVAAPTAAANVICGVANGIAVGAIVADGNAMLGGAALGAHACGAIVGLPFIPISYLCEEDPWYIYNDKRHESWSCSVSVKTSPQL